MKNLRWLAFGLVYLVVSLIFIWPVNAQITNIEISGSDGVNFFRKSSDVTNIFINATSNVSLKSGANYIPMSCVKDEVTNISSCTHSFPMSDLIEGKHSLTFRENETNYVYDFYVDGKEPNFVSNPNITQDKDNVILNLSIVDISSVNVAQGSGIKKISFYSGSQNLYEKTFDELVQEYSEQVIISGKDLVGEENFYVKVEDALGNYQIYNETKFVDFKKPIIDDGFKVMYLGEELNKISLTRDVYPKVDVEFLVDEDDVAFAYYDASELNAHPNYDYSNRTLVCEKGNNIKYVCKDKDVVFIPRSGDVKVNITVIDAMGNKDNKEIIKKFELAEVQGTVDYFGPEKEHCYEEECYVKGGINPIIFEITKGDIKIEAPFITLSVDGLSTNPRMKPIICEEGNNNKVVCRGYLSVKEDVEHKSTKPLVLARPTTDSLGAPLKGESSRVVNVDMFAPINISEVNHTMVLGGNTLENPCPVNGEKSLISVRVKDDFSPALKIVAHTSPISSTEKFTNGCLPLEETDEFLCAVEISDFYSYYNKEKLEIEIIDVAGNSLKLEKEVEICDSESYVEPNFITSIKVNKIPTVDLLVFSVIPLKVYIPFEFIKSNPKVQVITLSHDNCIKTPDGGTGNTYYVGGEEPNDGAILVTEVGGKGVVYESNMKIDVNCTVHAYLRTETTRYMLPEKEPINLELNTYNLPQGTISDSVTNKLENLKEEIKDIDSVIDTHKTWHTWIGGFCDILKVLGVINGIVAGVQNILYLLQWIPGVDLAFKGVCAFYVGMQKYTAPLTVLGKGGKITDQVLKFGCSVYTCSQCSIMGLISLTTQLLAMDFVRAGFSQLVSWTADGLGAAWDWTVDIMTPDVTHTDKKNDDGTTTRTYSDGRVTTLETNTDNGITTTKEIENGKTVGTEVVTDRNGEKTTTKLDGNGNWVSSTTTFSDGSSIVTYSNGRVDTASPDGSITVTDSGGNSRTTKNGQLISTSTMNFDASGNLRETTTFSNGNVHSTIRDENGKVFANVEQNADGSSKRTEYNAKGETLQITSKDVNGKITITEPITGRTLISDSSGQLGEVSNKLKEDYYNSKDNLEDVEVVNGNIINTYKNGDMLIFENDGNFQLITKDSIGDDLIMNFNKDQNLISEININRNKETGEVINTIERDAVSNIITNTKADGTTLGGIHQTMPDGTKILRSYDGTLEQHQKLDGTVLVYRNGELVERNGNIVIDGIEADESRMNYGTGTTPTKDPETPTNAPETEKTLTPEQIAARDKYLSDKEKLANLKSQITTIDNKLTEVNNNIGTTNNEIKTDEERLNQINSEIETTTKNIENNNNKIKEIKNNIVDLEFGWDDAGLAALDGIIGFADIVTLGGFYILRDTVYEGDNNYYSTANLEIKQIEGNGLQADEINVVNQQQTNYQIIKSLNEEKIQLTTAVEWKRNTLSVYEVEKGTLTTQKNTLSQMTTPQRPGIIKINYGDEANDVIIEEDKEFTIHIPPASSNPPPPPPPPKGDSIPEETLRAITSNTNDIAKDINGNSALIDPFRSIHFANQCFCNEAYIYNKEKLKQIMCKQYKCIEEMSSKGLSTIECDKAAKVGKCLYYDSATYLMGNDNIWRDMWDNAGNQLMSAVVDLTHTAGCTIPQIFSTAFELQCVSGPQLSWYPTACAIADVYFFVRDYLFTTSTYESAIPFTGGRTEVEGVNYCEGII